MGRLFGTDGVRGMANVGPMAPESVLALGRAVVPVLAPGPSAEKPRVVVGRDTRLSSPMIEAALTAGLCAAGADVLMAGVLPTPGVAYLVRQSHAVGGIVISASHNPYMDNGIKVFAHTGMKLDDDLEEAIEARLTHPALDAPLTGEALGCPRPYPEGWQLYGDFLQRAFRHETLCNLRVGLDCANGAASSLAPTVFQHLCRHVQVWNAAPDGYNINQQCGAVHPEGLQRHVVANNLDVGFAFDGDADRLIAVDHTGRILDGDYLLAVCAQALCREEPTQRLVVGTVMANYGLDQALHAMGCTLYRTPVGDKSVVAGMRHTGAWLGGEQSGHIVFLQHHTTGDGVLTAIQLLNAMAARRLPLATLAEVLQKCPQTLLNIPIHARREPLTLPAIQQAITVAEQRLGHTGRVVVRLSGTEAAVRVMVEGPEQALIEGLAQQIGAAVTHALGRA